MNFVDWRYQCILALKKAKEGKSSKTQKELDKNIDIIERMIEADEMLKFASAEKIQEFINAYRSLLEKEGLFDKLQYAKEQISLKLVELDMLKRKREGLLKPFLKGSDFLAAAEAFDKISKSKD